LTSRPARLSLLVRYRDAGVDIDANNRLKKDIARLARSTFTPGVLSEIGLFGSLFRMPRGGDPVLVASCDGVGTKLTVAAMVGKHDTVGIDIVNHCVNDILCMGARPLFFLDYCAASKTRPEVLAEVIRGLARACRRQGCALVGGETSTMPGWFRPGEYDLVGFIVGVVDRKELIDPGRIAPGDVLVGLPSDGLHTNGYSLARRALFERGRLTVRSRVKGIARPLGLELLRPHRSYFRDVYPLRSRVKAIAHITGGGFYDNLERLLPPETACVVRRKSWRPRRIFRLIQELGSVPDDEMYRTFNMGVGMVLVVAADRARGIVRSVRGARVIGRVVRGSYGVAVV